MAENSGIQWTDHTFNPWIGCVKVSPACKFCYAEAFDNRFGGGHWGPGTPRRVTTPAYWRKPLKWDKEAEKNHTSYRVFCASLADVFEAHEELDEPRQELFKLIENTPHLDWLLLTKRPENVLSMVPKAWLPEFPDNVWMGTTVENNERAMERIPQLANIPARVRFLSCEPLLSEITPNYTVQQGLKHIDWVIVGGESGIKARPLNLVHLKRFINAGSMKHVKLFAKQLGTVLAKELNLKDKKGGTMEEWPANLEWLKRREVPGA